MKKVIIKTSIILTLFSIFGLVFADANKSFGLQPNEISSSGYNYLGRPYPQAWVKFVAGSGSALFVLHKDYGLYKKTMSERTRNVYANVEYNEHYDKLGSGDYNFLILNNGSDNIYGQFVFYSSETYENN